MSKRRAIILSVVLEGRSQADTARIYEVSEAWVSRLVARWHTEGDTAFEARSRRPDSSPRRIPAEVAELIVGLRRTLTGEGLDAGPETIRWHLQHHHQVTVSASTARRVLLRAGLIAPAPKKRPRASFVRFEAELPNETWQTDMTHVRLASGQSVEVLTWLDDHSRFVLAMTAHRTVTVAAVAETFRETAAQHGHPASVLSDNGMYYTARFAGGGRSGPNRFETLLKDLGVAQKHSRPNRPTTCGKVERLQQTAKKWLAARPPADDTAGLQELLDRFVDEYNHRRPHASLAKATPAAVYARLPKTGPPHGPAVEHRVRTDRVDSSGKVTLRYQSRLYKIGIGRAHKGTPIVMLIADRHIRIVHAQTGQHLRQLTLDPTRIYQPRK